MTEYYTLEEAYDIWESVVVSRANEYYAAEAAAKQARKR